MIMQNLSTAALLHSLTICALNCIEEHKNAARAVRAPPYAESTAGNAGQLQEAGWGDLTCPTNRRGSDATGSIDVKTPSKQ